MILTFLKYQKSAHTICIAWLSRMKRTKRGGLGVIRFKKMIMPLERIKLPTPDLQDQCSATELERLGVRSVLSLLFKNTPPLNLLYDLQ